MGEKIGRMGPMNQGGRRETGGMGIMPGGFSEVDRRVQSNWRAI